jgi:hypothetical protein
VVPEILPMWKLLFVFPFLLCCLRSFLKLVKSHDLVGYCLGDNDNNNNFCGDFFLDIKDHLLIKIFKDLLSPTDGVAGFQR